MPEKRAVKDELRPSEQLMTLYYVYATPIFLILLLPILILSIFVQVFLFIFLAPFLLVFILVFLWIPMYFRTINYKLTRDDMTWRRGVWFKNTGIVPYNRITNVDIAQGPVSRSLGIASLKIQTAGYSAPSTRSSEIRIEGMKNFEQLRETIMAYVRGRKPVAIEAYPTEQDKSDPHERVIGELVRIRKALEKKR
jgi:membrane protein YdbS with pleckstrin-like domain